MDIILYNNNGNINKYKLNNNNQGLFFKLTLNSNNTSIKSIIIENENNKIKKLKKEYIFIKPILPYCFISKSINKKMKIIKTVRNKYFFCTKEYYITQQIKFNDSIPIKITKQYKKSKMYNSIETDKRKQSISYLIEYNKNINYSTSKKGDKNNNNIRKIKLKKFNIKNSKSKNTNNYFNNTGIFIKYNKNNSNKEIIPLLGTNKTNGENIKINLKKNKIFSNNNNNDNDKKLINNTKEEVNKVKLFKRNNIFREYSKTNKIKKRNKIKKSYSTLNKKYDHNLLNKNSNLMVILKIMNLLNLIVLHI